MTLSELINILNPPPASWNLNWAISDDAWYVGGGRNRRDTTLRHVKDNNRGTILKYFLGSNSGNNGWANVGFFEMNEAEIVSLSLYSDSNVKMLNELKAKLPEEIVLNIVDRR